MLKLILPFSLGAGIGGWGRSKNWIRCQKLNLISVTVTNFHTLYHTRKMEFGTVLGGLTNV